ncbi:outer membrane protein H.8-like [Narcine bancroftii]|uniref:outer membrane protein H.8-like n=1 Tax=Narcine bancroftii TaxID=1343680 RepID=UPI00383162BA
MVLACLSPPYGTLDATAAAAATTDTPGADATAAAAAATGTPGADATAAAAAATGTHGAAATAAAAATTATPGADATAAAAAAMATPVPNQVKEDTRGGLTGFSDNIRGSEALSNSPGGLGKMA